MKIIIAPQSFKGSLKANEAARAMEEGVKAAIKDCETVLLPIADGGEGMIRAMVEATGGKLLTSEVHGPLGDRVKGVWGMLGDGSAAVIEMAAASGLNLVPKSKLNPLLASTCGTGELIAAALESGCNKIIIGLGDSATVDGGAGMAQALGIKLLDKDNHPLGPGGAGLAYLERIDISRRHPLIAGCNIIAACDVTSPLYGVNGAAYVYGPQKGATPDMVEQLDAALRHFSEVIRKELGLEVEDMPGAGAAGGLGAGLVAFLNASLQRGIDIVCDSIDFDKHLIGSDLVLTGEGRIDHQTARGKTVAGIAGRAKRAGIPVIAIAGELGDGYQEVYECGVDAVVSILLACMERGEAMKNTANLVREAAERTIRLYTVGRKLR
jgi:glycerate kinase